MFVQARVIYVVGDKVGNASLIDKNLNEMGVKNKFFNNNPNVFSNREYINFLNKLPPECVFAIKKKSSTNNNVSHEFLVAIPFISSHLGLPIKVGETIWLQETEDITDKGRFFNINAFYLGRAHSYFTTEDVGYCYDERESSIFKNNKKGVTESNRTPVTAREKQEKIKNENTRSFTIYEHTFDSITQESKYVKNSSSYFKENIEKLSIKPVGNFIKKPEDIAIRGTYNNLISLTSEVDNDNNITRHGTVDLVAGFGDYSKNPPEVFNLQQQDYNNNLLSKKAQVLKYNSDVVGSQVWNGVHFETIKSNMAFPSENTVSKFKLNKFKDNVLNDKTDYRKDAAKLSVSEYNLRNIEIQKNNPLQVYDIQESVYESESISNTYSRRKLKHSVPFSMPDIDSFTLDTLAGGSSITGIADSIIFCTHNKRFSPNNNIKLIQTNSNDNNSSQISLNETGNIIIDGNKILIGSYGRLSKKENGKSALVYIGNSEESQSLVLGEQLQEFLLETLNVQVTAMKLLKDMLIDLNETNQITHDMFDTLLKTFKTWTSSAEPTMVGPLKPVGIVIKSLELYLEGLPKSKLAEMKTKNDENNNFLQEDLKISTKEYHSNRIKKVIYNLDKMLSKFTKTS
tara:strand:+ start:256 stop:2136 length:1881 start_codon:yes stop_codon:yes gene_type:complete